jgi:hypothetical protein
LQIAAPSDNGGDLPLSNSMKSWKPSDMSFRSAAAILSLLSAGGTALAADPVDPHFLALLKSDAHQQAVMKIATEQQREVPGGCATAQYRPVGEIDFFSPPQVDGAGRIVHGLWREQIAAVGCGTVSLMNVFSLAGPTGEPKLLGGLPGTTRADPVLQKEGLPIAARGLPDPAASCRDVRVVDTVLAPDAPKDRMAPWHENWTVLACNVAYQVPMIFTPTADGATIAVDAPPAAGPAEQAVDKPAQ